MAKSLRQRRHKARILAMQGVFQTDAQPALTTAELGEFRWVDYALPEEEREFARRIIAVTLEHLGEIDALITERLVNWELSRIHPVSGKSGGNSRVRARRRLRRGKILRS